MSDQNFRYVAERLFKLMNLKDLHQAQIQQGYTILVDDALHIDLIGLQPGFINLRASIGQLPDHAENEILRRLLYANHFAFEHPPVSVGLDAEKHTITVWSRQALAEIYDDTKCCWFDRFVQIASTIQNWLHMQAENAAHSPDNDQTKKTIS